MENHWTPTTKLIVLISSLVVVAWLLVQFGQSLPPLILAGVLAYFLKPPTEWLIRRTGWSRGGAAFVVLALTVLALVLAPVLLTPSLASLVARIQHEAAGLRPLLDRLSAETFRLGPLVLEGSDLVQRLVEASQALIAPLAGSAVSIVSGLASSLLWLLFILVVVFWLLKDSYRLRGWLLDHAPASFRLELIHLLQDMGLIWGSFFRGQILVSTTVGVIIGLSMWVMGVSNAFLLGAIAGLGEFVPTVGPIIAVLPALFIAFFNGSSWLPVSNPTVALVVLVVYTLVFQLDQVYIIPRFIGRRVQLHPGLVFVASIIGAVQAGVLGVLFAAPVLATARLLGGYIYDKLLDENPFSSPTAVLTPDQRGFLGGQPMAGILFDLDGTLADTDNAIVSNLAARLGRLGSLFPRGDPTPFLRRLAMAAEGPANWLVTQLDHLHLDDEAFRLNQWMQSCLGNCHPEAMKPVPGVEAALRTLKPTYKLALVTTRADSIAWHFLRTNDLEELFDAVVTRDDVRRLKPHPEPVLTASRLLGLEPQACVMVGDTVVDIRAGQAAGTRTIGVLCGFGGPRDLADADLILDSTADLVQRF